MEDDGVHVRPSLELPLPVGHRREGGHNEERTTNAVIVVQDGQERHRLQILFDAAAKHQSDST